MARRVSVMLAVAAVGVLASTGCGGGNNGAIGAAMAALRDGYGTQMGSLLPRGRSVGAELHGLPSHAIVEYVLTGPGTQVMLPDGRSVVSYVQTDVDKNGKLSWFPLSAFLADGDYTLAVNVVNGTNRSPITTHSFHTGLVTGVPSISVQRTGGAADPENHVFSPGDDLYVKAAGLPANQVVDLYLLNYDSSLANGHPLNDRSGFVPSEQVPIDQRRSLHGTAETVTTSSTGELPPTKVWATIDAAATGKRFEIVVDTDRDGIYDLATDGRTDPSTGCVGVFPSSRSGDVEVDVSADNAGNLKTQFAVEDIVSFVTPRGGQIPPSTLVHVYVASDKDNWQAGESLAVSTNFRRLLTTPSLAKELTTWFPIQSPDLPVGKYDIIVDVDRNGIYDPVFDLIDGSVGAAFEVTGDTVHKKWTVMYYLNADNDLEEDLINDLKELTNVSYGDQATAPVAVVAQIDRTPGYDASYGNFTGTNRYAVGRVPNGQVMEPVQQLGEVDSGSAEALRDFITWAKAYRPADHYVLVIGDHGSGFRNRSGSLRKTRGISFDTTSGTSLSPDDVRTVLQQTGGVDVLTLDACLMGMPEVANEFTDVCRVMIGSERMEPGAGHDNQRWIQWLVNTSDASASDVGARVIADWNASYTGTGEDATLVAYDMSKAQALRQAIDAFVRVMIDDPDGTGPNKPALERPGFEVSLLTVRSEGMSMEEGTAFAAKYDSHVDVESFFNRLKNATSETDVKTACDGVIAAHQGLLLAKSIAPHLVEHSGSAMWIPNAADFRLLRDDFKSLRFGKDTRWYEFLNALYSGLYTIVFEAANPDWVWYPFFSDDFDANQCRGGCANPSIEGYIPGAPGSSTNLVQTIKITEKAANKSYTLWGSYGEIPGAAAIFSGAMTVKVYRGEEANPIATVTSENIKCRNDITWNHWRVLTLNPKTGSLQIHNDVQGGGQ